MTATLPETTQPGPDTARILSQIADGLTVRRVACNNNVRVRDVRAIGEEAGFTYENGDSRMRLATLPPAAEAIAAALLLNEVFGDDDPDDEQWQERALCPQTDPELFFQMLHPLTGLRNGYKPGQVAAAKRICGACDVRSECLAYALRRNERFGIWGGLTEHERGIDPAEDDDDADDCNEMAV
jgi:WhiB family transcriptional regulator, redox-sensing transcriptional regulator